MLKLFWHDSRIKGAPFPFPSRYTGWPRKSCAFPTSLLYTPIPQESPTKDLHSILLSTTKNVYDSYVCWNWNSIFSKHPVEIYQDKIAVDHFSRGRGGDARAGKWMKPGSIVGQLHLNVLLIICPPKMESPISKKKSRAHYQLFWMPRRRLPRYT